MYERIVAVAKIRSELNYELSRKVNENEYWLQEKRKLDYNELKTKKYLSKKEKKNRENF